MKMYGSSPTLHRHSMKGSNMKLTTGHTRRHGKGIMSHEQILYFAMKGKFSWGIGFGEKQKCQDMIKAGLLKKEKRPSNWSWRDGELYSITNKGKKKYLDLQQ